MIKGEVVQAYIVHHRIQVTQRPKTIVKAEWLPVPPAKNVQSLDPGLVYGLGVMRVECMEGSTCCDLLGFRLESKIN